MTECFLGVDSGTQGTKAVVMEGGKGKVLGQASVAYECIPGLAPGVKEQHPEVWASAMEKAVKGAMRHAGIQPGQVKGIGISGQQHGFVPLDAEGNVIRPAKLWCDTSTLPQAESLSKKMGGAKKMISLTGSSLPVGYTASKILWLKQHEPKNYAKLATVLLPHDYLNFVLTGQRCTEAGDASGTGLFDTKTRNWELKVIAALDPALMDKLPPIRQAAEPAGEISLMASRRFGLPPGTLVSAGGGDNMMGAIGTGNIKPGVVTASLGTSGTIFAYSPRPIIDPEGEMAAFCDSTGAWLPLICTMNVTVATELVKKAFSWTNENLTAKASLVPMGSDGLFLLPYFEGERVPNLPLAKGVYFGMTAKNFTPGHMARAAMEGVALGLNYGLDRMRDLGVRPKQIRVTGGGSKNALWRQILADVFDAEVVGLSTSEGAAYGAALQAKWCYMNHRGQKARIQQLADDFVKVDKTTLAVPVRANTKHYRQLQQIHNAMSKAVGPVFEKYPSMG